MAIQVGLRSNSGIIPYRSGSPEVAGIVQAFAGSTAPTGWHVCDGTVLEQADYPQLFARLGSTWDTFAHPVDGTPTVGAGQFALPNLKGLYLAGSGGNGDSTFSLGSYAEDQIQAFGLNSTLGGKDALSGAGSFAFPSGSATGSNLRSGPFALPTSITGANTGNETRPKTAPMTYIIKLYDDQADVSVYIPPASATESGLLTASTQEIGGLKTFSDGIVVPSVADSFYRTETINLDGDFTGGSITVTKIGNTVTVSFTVLTHGSNASPTDGAVIPTWARPDHTKRFCYTAFSGSYVGLVQIGSNGDFQILYYSDLGVTTSKTTTSQGSGVTYTV